MASTSNEPPSKKMRECNPILKESRIFKFVIEKSVSDKFAFVDPGGQVHYSDKTATIAGMPWRVKLFVNSPRHYFFSKEHNQKPTSYISPNDAQLKLKVNCNSGNKSSLWSCQSFIQFEIWVGPKDVAKANGKIINKSFERKFDRTNTSESLAIIDWAELVDPKKCYLPSGSNNDSKFMEMELFVEMKVDLISLAGYSLPLPPDSMLVVKSSEGRPSKPICVNSYALAAYSDFFKGLFFGSFKDQLANYEILEEDLESFETMLKLLDLDDMGDVSITVDNVPGLLRLADKYIIPSLQRKCLAFLMSLGEKHMLLKLQLADAYSLAELENQCLNWLAIGHMLEQLRTDITGYNALSDRTKLAILDSAVLFGVGQGGSHQVNGGARAFVVDQDGRVWPPTRSPSPSQ